MFGEKYFSPQYFNAQFFGPLITDDVTIRIVTYWSPQYFGVKYFSPQYFGKGLRFLPQVYEKEGEDSYGTFTEGYTILEVALKTSSDTISIGLEESVPLFTGQFFFLTENLSVVLDEFASIDKVAEWEDGLSVNLIETAIVGVVSEVTAQDNIAIRAIDSAVKEEREYYIDVPTKPDPGSYYKDYNK